MEEKYTNNKDFGGPFGPPLQTRGRLTVKTKPGCTNPMNLWRDMIIEVDGVPLKDAFELDINIKQGRLVEAHIGFYVKDLEVDAKAMTFLLDLPAYEETYHENDELPRFKGE